jgi:hypothetical protein
LFNNTRCNCKNCKYNEWYYTWKKDGHLKLDFDAREYTKSNLKIVQLFDEYFAEIKVVIHSHKGSIEAYFIHLDDYNKYDYWKQSYQEMKLPYIAHIDLTDIGTVEIIKTIIEIITKIAFFHSIFPKTITITSMNENNIVIDCEKNFTEDEKNVIYKYKIHRLKDLVTHPIIHAIDKTQCLLYYNLVLENYNANGFEVFVNFASIQLDKYLFNIIVLHDQTIKYCSCSGETSFLIINQNYML